MLNLRHGIYLIIFFMPLYLWRFSILGIPTTVLEMMICILFLVWVINEIRSLLLCHFEPVRVRNLRMLLCKKNVHIKTALRSLSRSAHFEMTKKEKVLNILNIGIILLFLGIIISTALSSDIRTSLGIFKGWFVDPFLFFVVFINVIKKEKQLVSVLKSWLASGVAVSLISIFYLLNNNLTFDGRLKAFFLSPNHLAMYIAPAFLITLFFLLNRRVFSIEHLPAGRHGLVLSTFLLIILIPLYFTYSCGAFLGIFAGILYLVFKNKTNKSMSKIRNIYLISLIILILSGFIFTTSNKFNQIISSDSRSSFHSRLMIWNASAEIIKDNPFFGIGPGTFQDVYLSYAEKFDEQYLEWAVPQPHNIFLAFYLQTGTIGFIGFILVLFWFFNINLIKRRHFKMSSASSTINIIIVSLMIYVLAHGLIDTTYWKNDLSLIFWLIVGMMVVSRRITYDEDHITRDVS